jgi:hypothetical protein
MNLVANGGSMSCPTRVCTISGRVRSIRPRSRSIDLVSAQNLGNITETKFKNKYQT